MTTASHARERRGRATLLVVLVLLSLGLLAPAAQGAETDTMRLEPSPLRVEGRERRSFDLGVQPGQRASDAVRLTNLSDAPRRYRIYAADAHADAVTGAFTVPPATAPAQGVGRWIRTDAAEVELAPGESRVVGFTVARPEGSAAEGFGAVVAEELAETPTGGGVEVVFRLAILVRVDGPAAGLSATAPWIDAPMAFVPGSATVAVEVTNERLEPVAATVRLEVHSATGRVWRLPPQQVQLPPSTTTTVEAPWTTVPRWGGVLTPRVDVEWPAGSLSAVGDPFVHPPVWLVALLIAAVGVRGARELRVGTPPRTTRAT